ncbi:glycosyltransferase family 4 protein [Acuticoccus sp. M5D2P5]|uniref:glycosyltransferase family 4 protein n=1 Tax=Acuticoccus kalidii TaxID=2910977 RepID=UPI001F1DF801|nr:glycosyltransferase family 4 protein [Acuticoccus kalidii]MCF3932288.1 glycosyltransferase family 4 protein [Acuticoccus kalidii]
MSARPMTILQVVPELETGGAERTTIDIAAALVEHGDRAIVVSEGGRMLEELRATGAEHVTMPVATKAPLRMRSNAVRLADLMEREGVDIIHARSRAPAWSALWAANWTRRRFVTTYHGAYNARTVLKNRYNSVMARGDIVIANSAFTAERIVSQHPFAASRIVTIHRGIDLSAFDEDASARADGFRRAWNVDARIPILLNVARLTPWKGQEDLLDALALLKARNAREWVCVLAGDDQGRAAYTQKLRDKMRQLGLEDRVRLVGHVDDIPGALAAATLAVQPAIEPEAFGRAAVEAQAAGRPVVVTDLGAVRETVLAPPDVGRDKRTGWRVPPHDPVALAEAMFQALQASNDSRSDVGMRGRAHALSHFSLDVMKRKTLGVYHSLLEDDISALY